MSEEKLSLKVFGKWILAGEHSVLRGAPALVFPVYGRSFSLKAVKTDEPLNIEFGGMRGQEVQVLFSGIFDKALTKLNRQRSEVRGNLVINNEIPVGAGMGASAALCVAVSKYLMWQRLLEEKDLYEFSRGLEDTFHGESSGVDIAVALSGSGLEFQRSGLREDVLPNWQPNWYLSYCGQRGLTHECVAKVKQFLIDDPERGEALDAQMAESVQIAKSALLGDQNTANFDSLAKAIEMAAECFQAWGLSGGLVNEHITELKSAGAIACKPTGSGNGGFVLSLWDKVPSGDITEKLISLAK